MQRDLSDAVSEHRRNVLAAQDRMFQPDDLCDVSGSWCHPTWSGLISDVLTYARVPIGCAAVSVTAAVAWRVLG